VAESLAAALAPADPELRVEAFPRQSAVAPGGLGNLVKLPLGLHLRSGRRALLLDAAGKPLDEPFVRLRAIRRSELGAPVEAAGTGGRCQPPGAPVQRPAPAHPEAPAWTEADLEASPAVGPVYRGCSVVRALVERVLATRSVDRQTLITLVHTLGHSEDGVRAVNYLCDRVSGFPAEQRMGAPHRGHPTSCARIRQRHRQVADEVGCACPLPVPPGGYAHPLLHRAAESPPAPRDDLDELLSRLGLLVERHGEMNAEVSALRRAVVERLAEVPDRRWRVAGGEWCLDSENGIPVLTWEAG
jgi:hypothetical protein